MHPAETKPAAAAGPRNETRNEPSGPGESRANSTARATHTTSSLERKEAPPIMTAFTHTRLLYKIPEAMQVLSISRSVIFEQIKAGRLRAVKEGRALLIPATAIDDYVTLLEREAQAEVA